MLRQVKGKHLLILVAGIVALLLAVACTPSAQPSAERAEAPKGPAGRAVVAFAPMTTGGVDPALSRNNASDFPNIEALYNRLLEMPKESPTSGPGLATEWSMSTDGLTWEVKIRKGVKFHNGDELTPEDVVFTMERILRVALPAGKSYFEEILEKVEAKGQTVIFHLKKPDWTFFLVFTSSNGGGYSIVPKKHIEQVGDEAFRKAPVGTGPFKFVKWAKQEFLKLEAIDYEHFLWQPGVKQLEYQIVPEETTRLAMVRTGEADLAQVSVTSLKTIEGDPKLRAMKVPNIGGLRLMMFGQHDSQNPLSKLEVRKALSLAIDREAIANGIYQGYARPLGTAVGGFSGAIPDWAAHPPYDLSTAKELLAKAGYPGGKGLKLTLHNYEYAPRPLWTQVAPVIASQWGKLGIQVELRQWEWGAWAPAARTGKLEPVSVGTHLGASGTLTEGSKFNDFVRTGLYSHASGTADGAYPELADMAEQFERELDPAKRAALMDKIMAYARDKVVFIPVIDQDALWVAGPRLLEYTPRPSSQNGNMWTIKVKP